MSQAQSESDTARDPGFRADLLVGQVVRAGLKGRCPHCGQGALFQGFLKVMPRCAVCDYDLASVETGDGAATFIMQIAGGIVGFSALAVELKYHRAILVHLLIWVPLVVGLSLGLMQPGKGLMTALQILRNRDN